MQRSAALAPVAYLEVQLFVCNEPMGCERWWQCLVQVADSVKDLSSKCIALCNEFGIEPLVGAQVILCLRKTACKNSSGHTNVGTACMLDKQHGT